MKNVQMSVQGNKLIVTIDLTQRQGRSSSGKNVVIATTSGNVSVPDQHDSIKIGINCYAKE